MFQYKYLIIIQSNLSFVLFCSVLIFHVSVNKQRRHPNVYMLWNFLRHKYLYIINHII
jgi:hypothetical protein